LQNFKSINECIENKRIFGDSQPAFSNKDDLVVCAVNKALLGYYKPNNAIIDKIPLTAMPLV
jgi:hypothetical protein|tara:strand:+ start:1062 stop:1247 length:186 start_codon:yes stop_codon:yes gene_type:complete